MRMSSSFQASAAMHESRRLLVGELNAAIKGLLEAKRARDR